MKEFFKLVAVLTGICLIAGVLLAFVSNLTAGPIAATERARKLTAIDKVLPEYDNEPDRTTLEVETKSGKVTFYVARISDTFAGAAFQISTKKGYGGTIELMAGINPDDEIHAIEVLKQTETPGLGAKISTPAFRDQFAGKLLSHTDWLVKKDGGDIDEITAATISSRAVVEALKDGISLYLANKDEIMRAQPATRKETSE